MSFHLSNDGVSRAHVDALCIEADYREECFDVLSADIEVDDSEQEEMSAEEFARYVEIRNVKHAERKALMAESDIAFALGNMKESKPLVYIKNPPLTADGERLAQMDADNVEPVNMETPERQQRLAHIMEYHAWIDSIMDDIDE